MSGLLLTVAKCVKCLKAAGGGHLPAMASRQKRTGRTGGTGERVHLLLTGQRMKWPLGRMEHPALLRAEDEEGMCSALR